MKRYENTQIKQFSKEEISIIQRAKIFGVDTLSNENLAYELFNLKFENDIDKEYFEILKEFQTICQNSLKNAQISS